MCPQVDFFTLGTGAVCSVPNWGCQCPACHRIKYNPQFIRTPCSGVVRITDKEKTQYVMLDAGQTTITERYNRQELSAFVLTHYHADHVQGLLSIRWHKGDAIAVYGRHSDHNIADLQKNRGILKYIEVSLFESFSLHDVLFVPVPLQHSIPTCGYVITYHDTTMAYCCDTKGLPDSTTEYLQSLSLNTVILDCTTSPEKSYSGHCNLLEAEQIYQSLRPEYMYLTHIEHDFDLWLLDNPIPQPLQIAYDNQKILTF